MNSLNSNIERKLLFKTEIVIDFHESSGTD
jgi:hypothetical protein